MDSHSDERQHQPIHCTHQLGDYSGGIIAKQAYSDHTRPMHPPSIAERVSETQIVKLFHHIIHEGGSGKIPSEINVLFVVFHHDSEAQVPNASQARLLEIIAHSAKAYMQHGLH